MAVTLKRSDVRHKNKKNRKALKIVLITFASICLIIAFFIIVGLFKKDNIKKKNDNPQAFPVSIEQKGVFYVEYS